MAQSDAAPSFCRDQAFRLLNHGQRIYFSSKKTKAGCNPWPPAFQCMLGGITRMKKSRVFILAAIAGTALVLPWSELGALGIQFLVPILLGICVTWLFADWSVRAVESFCSV
jgi:hypothetical protein